MKRSDVIVMCFHLDELRDNNVFENAEKAVLNGRSHIRSGMERREKCLSDNITGQICQYAGTVYLTGSSEAYHHARAIANANPYSGDGGSDIPGYKIDIKGSEMRRSENPLAYNLAVRPAERSFGKSYILVLAKQITKESYTVYIVGSDKERMLPDKVNESGVFAGAYVLPATKLSPLLEFAGYCKNRKCLQEKR